MFFTDPVRFYFEYFNDHSVRAERRELSFLLRFALMILMIVILFYLVV